MLQLPARRAKRVGLLLLAVFWFGAGVNHFVNPDFYVAIMPSYVPAHLELVVVSGVFEILGGLGVLVPSVRARVGWGLIILLLAVFPANLNMALHPELFADVPVFALYGRLPIQGLLVAWAYWATRPEPTPVS